MSLLQTDFSNSLRNFNQNEAYGNYVGMRENPLVFFYKSLTSYARKIGFYYRQLKCYLKR